MLKLLPFKLKRATNQGDTIVEVLIVLAVLGFALSISYASASRSLKDAEQSEQNSYATKLAEQQIEEIRAVTIQSTPGPGGNGIAAFSFPTQACPATVTTTSNCQIFFMTDNNETTQAAAIQITPTNTLTDTAYGATYTITDYYYPQSLGSPPINFNNFAVNVSWPDISGGTNNVWFYYRVYP
jgi:type II secretory pathway pseudopilin PulG